MSSQTDSFRDRLLKKITKDHVQNVGGPLPRQYQHQDQVPVQDGHYQIQSYSDREGIKSAIYIRRGRTMVYEPLDQQRQALARTVEIG